MNYNNDELLEKFKNYLSFERNYSDHTIYAYYKDLENLKIIIKKDLLKVTNDDLKKYLSIISKSEKKNLSSRTIAHKISSFNAFYNYYIRTKIIENNPTEGLYRPKLESKLPVFLTIKEINKLLNYNVSNHFEARDKAILELLYSSGLRINELVNLELSNTDLDDCLVRVMGKGKKERIIPLGDYAVIALKDYIENYRHHLNKKNNTYIFLNNRGDKISRQFIFKTIKNECQKKGISKNVSPHTLRHTFATHLHKNGVDLRIIQELLGHEKLSTTQIYTHLGNETLHKTYDKCDPRV